MKAAVAADRKERDADTQRRIRALWRTKPWLENPRDYQRISRVVDRVAILGEDALTEEEKDRLDVLAALMCAFDAGRYDYSNLALPGLRRGRDLGSDHRR